MNILELANALHEIYEQRGNVTVVLEEENGDLVEVEAVKFKVAGKNEYPKDWNMPEGFEFVKIGAYTVDKPRSLC